MPQCPSEQTNRLVGKEYAVVCAASDPKVSVCVCVCVCVCLWCGLCVYV